MVPAQCKEKRIPLHLKRNSSRYFRGQLSLEYPKGILIKQSCFLFSAIPMSKWQQQSNAKSCQSCIYLLLFIFTKTTSGLKSSLVLTYVIFLNVSCFASLISSPESIPWNAIVQQSTTEVNS